MVRAKPIVGAANRMLEKIVTGTVFNRWARPWFLKIAERFELDEVRKGPDGLNLDAAPRLDFSHYLPDTPARLERLRRIVNGRTVAVIAHGPSVKTLEARIEELRDLDICYFGVNAFSVPEQHILARIGRAYDVVMASGVLKPESPIVPDALRFLERPQENLFISEAAAVNAWASSHGPAVTETLRRHDDKLLFFTSVPETAITIGGGLSIPFPGPKYPLHFLAQSSLSILLSLAIIGGAPRIVVFGGDGGHTANEATHYRGTGVEHDEKHHETSLAYETRLFNASIPLILEQVARVYSRPMPDVINCTPRSNYTTLRRLGYDETFQRLRQAPNG